MGAKRRDLERRRRAVGSTMKITRAMELVATARISKAQQRLVQARPYARRIAEAIRELAGVTEIEHEFPLLKPRAEIRTVGILLVTSDRGLCGAYNANVIRVAEKLMREAAAAGLGTRLHVVGRKGVSYFRFRRYALASETIGVSDRPPFDVAERLGQQLVDGFVAGEVDQVLVAYTDFRSSAAQVATSTQILPISKEEVAPSEGQIAPLYEFEPEPGAILGLLLPRYVNTVVFAALLESAVSEYAMRRRAMKAATDNAQELVKILTRVINRERQAEITKQLLEVTSGAEALRKAAANR